MKEPKTAELINALKRLVEFANDVDRTLFHHNHDVIGWHLNDAAEPMMNFAANMDTEAIAEAERVIELYQPEPVEPITPEALEKEGFAPSPMKDFLGKGHLLVRCKNDKATVWVYTVSEDVAITAKGVTIMQQIRQLIKLIGE